MHFLATQTRALDEAAPAVDLAQTPADVVILSFADTDLSVLALAHAARPGLPGLRLASLSQLRHPYSVDMYLERTCASAKFVLVRLLGGVDYWRYGVDELAALARHRKFHLAIVPGDHREDPRMDRASTLDEVSLRQIWAYFQEGGPENMGALLASIAARLGCRAEAPPPVTIPAFGLFDAGCRQSRRAAGRALVVFYRSVAMAADTLPIVALANALHRQHLTVTSVFVTSLKDPAATSGLAALIAAEQPDVILNTTAFSARTDAGASVLDGADAPVLQVILGGASAQAWADNPRGLGAADLAMNVVLPETDGRLITRAISFKAEAPRSETLQFARVCHQPEPTRVAYVAELAANWTRLRRARPAQRRIACILSDYPGKGGRAGHAVGLDTPASVRAIARALRAAGYGIGPVPRAAGLMQALTGGVLRAGPSLTQYQRWFDGLPKAFRDSVLQCHGAPQDDAAIVEGAFCYRFIRTGNLTIALQPGRGRKTAVRGEYHDTSAPPCHGYVAFYLWLRHAEKISAMIHCGTHGTLEWLPGKAVALSEECAPEVLLGAVPVVYPFIVNNPGEAAQAKRRLGAIALGHLTPPLMEAGGQAGLEVEALLDEYANARSLDPRRARHLAVAILERAEETGLARDSGIAGDEEPETALARLDAFLCDCKEMRIRDGLHVFGQALPRGQLAEMAATMLPAPLEGGRALLKRALAACARGEMQSLLRALDGRFIQPGPGGAPSRGRLDVLPTGRNLFSVDPRQVPTRAAWEIGQRTAAEIMLRHAQDQGDWPRSLVMDLWGSATMRTGGDEIAQAMALMGVRPTWDPATSRVLGFEIIPAARLERPRVDVTLRISGLFRDVFASQIVLLDQAVQAVAAMDEDDAFNPLAQAARRSAQTARIFGAAPGTYGIGLGDVLASGNWQADELGQAYLNAGSHAYGGSDAAANRLPEAFAERVQSADAFVHVQDMAEQDILDSSAFAEHEGGFAAAAKLLGSYPVLYHADTSAQARPKIRTLREELARVLRGRAANPKWIAGQMRHGFAGAAEIAETVDNLFAYAALADVVDSRHFDLLFDAYCDADAVRAFLTEANPVAASAIAARFEEAQRRGLWQSRRNSVAARLAEMRGAR